MAIRRVSSSSVISGAKSSKLWDGLTFPEYYESIATAIADADGVSAFTFNNIPQNYKSLHIRCSLRTNRSYTGNAVDAVNIKINGTSYPTNGHYLLGDGGGISVGSGVGMIYVVDDGGGIANNFAAVIFDIPDYTDTSKNKVMKSIGGFDNNSTSLNGTIALQSYMYATTNPITSISFEVAYGTLFNRYSQVALYGVR